MARSFLSNFSFTLVLNLFVKLFWVFVIEISVQNTLGTETYGVYFESFNFSYIFFILLDLGLSNYTSRTVAGDQSALKKLFPAILSIKVILTVVYLIVLLGAGLILGYDALHLKVVLFIGFCHVLMSMLLFFRSNIAGLHLFRTDAVLSIADRLVMGILCALFLWTPAIRAYFSLDFFLGAQVVGYLFSTVLAFVMVRRHGARMALFFDPTLFKSILKKSYPFAVLFFLMGLYTRLDSVMLGRMLDNGDFEVGIYASAFRLLDATIIFAVLLSNLLLPMFSRLISQGESVRTLVKESYRVLLIPTVILPLSCLFYSDLIYPLLYDHHHAYGGRVFGLLFINFIPMAMGYIFGTLLTAKSELRLLNIISIGGLIINIILNALFIPRWQSMGAVYATIITQSFVSFASLWYSLRYFDIRISDLINWRIVGFIIANFLGFYFIKNSGLAAPFALSISILIGLIWVHLFRLIRIGEIAALIRSKSKAS